MEQLLRTLLQIPEAAEAADALEEGRYPVAITGLAAIHRAQLAAALAWKERKIPVVLCSDEGEAARMAADLHALTGMEPLTLLPRELHRSSGAVTSRQWEHRRIAALYQLASGSRLPLVATVEAMLQKTCPPDVMRGAALTLRVG